MASRLKEERHRIDPHQGHFAARIGLKQGKYGHLETGFREAKAEDLAAMAAAGVDVHYVLTGQRLDIEALDPETNSMLSDYLALPAHLKPIARAVLKTLSNQTEGPPSTLHEGRLVYSAGNG